MANKVAFNENYPEITRSNELYERAKPIMTPVTQTLAKGPGQWVKGIAPKYLKKGKGSHVWDVDGNEYIDYIMGVGPISLGYAYDRVDQAIIEQLKDGITFSMMHELEVELAELLNKIIPNAESVRISKTGADVCSAALPSELQEHLQEEKKSCAVVIMDGTTGTSQLPAVTQVFRKKLRICHSQSTTTILKV
jgi:glutamate-1-semialdehyde 2,1-aminomutase